MTEAEVSEESATPKVDVGTIGYLEDGRRFRYCKAGAALSGAGRLAGNANYAPGCTGQEDANGYEGAIYVAAAIGAHIVRIDDTNARAADYYKGGYLNIFHATSYRCHRILTSKRNSVSTDPGYGAYVELTLESGITAAVTTSTGITAYLNPYGNVKSYGGYSQSYVSFVCLPLIPITSTYYFWGQVGGPAWVTAHGGTWPGSAANYRDLFGWIDGTVDPSSVADPTSGYQRIGTLISQTVSGYGDAFVMLQLDGG